MTKLIKCGGCGNQISQQAPVCPQCGHPNKQSEYLSGGQVFMGLLIAAGAIWFMATRSGGGSDSPVAAPAPPPQPVLELLSQRCEKRHGYLYAIGEVRNISGVKLDNIMAVGEFVTKSGELVASEDALLEYNPLMPGQKSPFEVGTRPNPMSTGCRVDFKTFGGTRVLWREVETKERK